ncbi:MAG: DUF6432 family protein [Halodesulfurarchaeum sp.]
MELGREHRNRDGTQVAVLEALVERGEEGMTLFELRSVLGVDIDELEGALSGLRDAELVRAEQHEQRVVFVADAAALAEEDTDPGFLGWLRKKLGWH